MEYRALGQTGLRVSAVGFGTAQLRRVTERQAIETLLAGFERGVNMVHVAPDYGGAEDLVATAVRESGKPIIVACNGYDVAGNEHGRPKLFERQFEQTCRRLRTDRLDLFGIASPEDREALKENIWGRCGMVEFLQRMKAKGRLGATFCTTHGKPEFARKLIESGAFDAVMLAYTDLGFHALTLNPPAGWHFEDLRRTRDELFPLCQQRSIGVMVMLPLAGGMLLPSKAFPREPGLPDPEPKVSAADVLRTILARPQVSCVLPGTACVEEAEENAAAGSAVEMKADASQRLQHRLKILQSSLCNRCSQCEPTCSKKLPISWLFRSADMAAYNASPHETWEDVEYFRLHPDLALACESCTDRTCACPSGINVPAALAAAHARMLNLLSRGRVQAPVASREAPTQAGALSARIVTRELPDVLYPRKTHLCRVHLENTGTRAWTPRATLRQPHQIPVELRVVAENSLVMTIRPRHVVHPGERTHFVFELAAPDGGGRPHLRLQLKLVDASRYRLFAWPELPLYDIEIPFGERCTSLAARGGTGE